MGPKAKLAPANHLSLLNGKLGDSEKKLLGPPITFSFSHSQHGSKCERTHLMPDIILDPTQYLHIILVLSDELIWSLGDNHTDWVPNFFAAQLKQIHLGVAAAYFLAA